MKTDCENKLINRDVEFYTVSVDLYMVLPYILYLTFQISKVIVMIHYSVVTEHHLAQGKSNISHV